MKIKKILNEWWNTLEFYLNDEEMRNAEKDKILILQYIEKLEDIKEEHEDLKENYDLLKDKYNKLKEQLKENE